MSGNRRKYPRVRAELEIRLRISDRQDPIDTWTQNLSASGLELVCSIAIDVPSELEVEFTLPGEDTPLKIKGRVVRAIPSFSLWGRIRNLQEKYTVGINFLELDYADRVKIINYLQSISS